MSFKVKYRTQLFFKNTNAEQQQAFFLVLTFGKFYSKSLFIVQKLLFEGWLWVPTVLFRINLNTPSSISSLDTQALNGQKIPFTFRQVQPNQREVLLLLILIIVSVQSSSINKIPGFSFILFLLDWENLQLFQRSSAPAIVARCLVGEMCRTTDTPTLDLKWSNIRRVLRDSEIRSFAPNSE